MIKMDEATLKEKYGDKPEVKICEDNISGATNNKYATTGDGQLETARTWEELDGKISAKVS